MHSGASVAVVELWCWWIGVVVLVVLLWCWWCCCGVVVLLWKWWCCCGVGDGAAWRWRWRWEAAAAAFFFFYITCSISIMYQICFNIKFSPATLSPTTSRWGNIWHFVVLLKRRDNEILGGNVSPATCRRGKQKIKNL